MLDRFGKSLARKLLALTLTAALGAVFALAGLPGRPVLAADARVAPTPFSDISGHPAEYELTVMAALGIMTGDAGLGGPVRPDATITRAEICKILVGALGYARLEPTMRALQPTFKDGAQIPAWAWGWVNIAQQLNLIAGYPDGTFKAGNTVNYNEVVAMLVRCVFGHDQQVKKSPMPWPMNYIGYAVMWGFTGDVTPYGQLPATRGDVAKMIYATMQVNQVSADGVEKPNTSLLSGRLVQGQLNSFSGTTATIGSASHPLADPYYLCGASSLAEMQYVDVLGLLDKKTDGKWVLIKKVGSSSTAAGLVYTGTQTSNGVTYLVFQGNKTIPYHPGVPTTLNGESGLHENALVAGDLCLVRQGSDQYALSITATRFDIGQDYLTAVTASSGSTDTRITTKSRGSFSIPTSCTVTVNGSSSSRDSLAANDVVRIATAGAHGVTPWRIEATRRTVEGTVADVTTSYPGPVIRVTINRTSGGSATYVLDSTYLTAPSNGDRVKYGLDADNKLYVPIPLTTSNTIVYVSEATVSGGSPPSYSIKVDCTSTTYTCTVDPTTWYGKFGKLTLDGYGRATGFTEYAPVAGFTLKAPAATAVTMDGPGGVCFGQLPDFAVYRKTSTGYERIGPSGLMSLPQGTPLKAYVVGSTVYVVVYEP